MNEANESAVRRLHDGAERAQARAMVSELLERRFAEVLQALQCELVRDWLEARTVEQREALWMKAHALDVYARRFTSELGLDLVGAEGFATDQDADRMAEIDRGLWGSAVERFAAAFRGEK